MIRSIRAALPLGLLLLALVGFSASATTPMPENGAPNHAGLVIKHGDGRLTYALVAFSEAEVSGADLLQRSGIEQLTIPFGGLGIGVCALEGEGCEVSECRRRVCRTAGEDAPFWQYFRQSSPGVWVSQPLGASASRVTDGQVDLWAWTGQPDPGIPALTIAEVARLAGAPDAGTERTQSSYVQTSYPPGWSDDSSQRRSVYLAAGAILALIILAGIVGLRRVRPPHADV